MIVTIVVALFGFVLIAATIFACHQYVKYSRKKSVPLDIFTNRREELGVVNNGTSMNDKEIYVYSPSDLGL